MECLMVIGASSVFERERNRGLKMKKVCVPQVNTESPQGREHLEQVSPAFPCSQQTLPHESMLNIKCCRRIPAILKFLLHKLDQGTTLILIHNALMFRTSNFSPINVFLNFLRLLNLIC